MYSEELNQLLTEAVDIEYPVREAMPEMSKERKLYFYSFEINGMVYVVKFINQWYNKGKIGPNSYIVSVHSVKSSGLLHKKVLKINNPSAFLSGLFSCISAFEEAVRPHALILRIESKDQRSGKIAQRVMARIPLFKSKYDAPEFTSVRKLIIGFILRKGRSPSSVLAGIIKDADVEYTGEGSPSIAELLANSKVASKLEDEAPVDPRVYRIKKEQVVGMEFENPEVREFAKNHPVAPRAKALDKTSILQKIDKVEIPGFLDKPNELYQNPRYVNSLRTKLNVIYGELGTDFKGPPPITNTQANVLKGYTGGQYRDYREFFLMADFKKITEYDDDIKKKIVQFDKVFKNYSHGLEKGIEVFRGMVLATSKDMRFIKSYTYSSYIKLASFTSFSLNPKIATQFSGLPTKLEQLIVDGEASYIDIPDDYEFKSKSVNFLLVVRGLENASAIIPGNRSSYASEHEVILNRESILKVTNRKLVVDEFYETIILELECVDASQIVLEDCEITYSKMISEAIAPKKDDPPKLQKLLQIMAKQDKGKKVDLKLDKSRADKYNSAI